MEGNGDKMIPDYLSKIPVEVMYEGDTGKPFKYFTEDNRRIFGLRYTEAPVGSLPSDSYFEYRSDTGSWTQNNW